jgi:RNA polymerase sigma factor FliA
MYTATGKSEKNDMLEQYIPMVKRIAHHMKGRLPPNVEEDDLVQAGMIGLLDAISRYDETLNSQFEGYAIQRIRGAMIDELRQSDWMPRGARQSMRKIEDVIGKLQHRLGRPPMESEIAEALKMPLDEYQTMLADAKGHQLIYLEDFGHNGEEDESFLDRNCPDNSSVPLEKLLDADLKVCLIEAIDILPEREKLLMSLYYEQELNLKEIGEIMGVSISRVSQLHSLAVARLRTWLREKSWIPAA